MFPAFIASLALLPFSTRAQFDQPIPGLALTFQGPNADPVTSCDPIIVQWTWSAEDNSDVPDVPLILTWTNEGTPRTGGEVREGIIAQGIIAQARSFVWREVTIPEPGLYEFSARPIDGVSITNSSPFQVIVDDTSCLVPATTSDSETSSPSSSSSTTANSPNSPGSSSSSSSSSQTPSGIVAPAQPNSSGSRGTNVAAIVGAVFGVVTVLALIGSFWFYRRRRNLKDRAYPPSRPEKPKRQGKWGGLSSIDNRAIPPPGNLAIPTVPYVATSYTTSKGDSVGHPADDVAAEKSSPTSVKEQASPEEEGVSELNRRASNRYSSGALAAALAKRNSGLAAFTNERTKSASKNPGSPTSPVDPFGEASFRARANRSSSLSLPSTAHPSPGSDIPPLPPTVSESESGRSTATYVGTALGRSSSANAVPARPGRKPVRYDAPIEMQTTTQHVSPSPGHSLANLSMSNDSNAFLSSSVDSTSSWLQDRAPTANRNIGLAGQTEGPVHYLIPDMPPPARR